MSDTVQEIKDRLSIVDVIAPYVTLKKAGRHHKGLCPFHNEKTPSFMVSPERGFYHCFGCGRGGDMFTFVQELEGLDFRGALALLAEKAGVPVITEPKAHRDRREKLFAILEDARDFFRETLDANKAARAYLEKRGISSESVQQWGLGYAPAEWRATLEHLSGKGYDASLIEAAGLVKKPEETEGRKQETEKKPYDRFRGRIIFPISDVSGRIIGFSGRLFPETEREQAKYLNSPETDVFDKSRVLYGFDRAKSAIRKYGFAILVEGQLDLLLAHQAGYANTVALSGTAFTEAHARLIKRYAENLVLAFDGDRAGVAASGRAALLALGAGLNVKLATLPPNEDPADVIQRDTAEWKHAIKGAVHVVDFYLAYLTNLYLPEGSRAGPEGERRFKLEVTRTVLPYIAAVENAVDRAHFVSVVAGRLGVPEIAVAEELGKLTKEQETNKKKQEVGTVQETSDLTEPAPSEPFLSRSDTLERLLVGLYQALDDEEHQELHDFLETRLSELIGQERVETVLASPEEARVSAIESDLFLDKHDENGDLATVVRELLDDLEHELVRLTYRDLTVRLKRAEQDGDQETIEAIVAEMGALAKKL